MFQLPDQLTTQYRELLATRGVKVELLGEYLKWLRFFLDFCEKYKIGGLAAGRLRRFIQKLKEKNQSEDQRRRAYHAVSLYFEMLPPDKPSEKSAEMMAEPVIQKPAVLVVRKSFYSEAGYQEKSDSPEWDAVLETMAGEIKVRHYSRKTLKTYANWSRKFQRFLINKPPQELTGDDVKQYLTHLAVTCKVASTTQNQAFNSLLFFFRHGLHPLCTGHDGERA